MTPINWCKLMVVAAAFGCVVAKADTATVPHVFADDTPALANEVNQNFSALATAINANIDSTTVISLDVLGTTNFDGAAVPLGTFDFNKVSATSHIVIVYEDTLTSLNQESACAVSLRVDGVNSRGVAAPGPPAIQTASRDFVGLSATGVFTGLTAGTHTIALIGSTLNDECRRGDRPFGASGQIVVVETAVP
ncbi:MAG: hypothetical protein ACR2RB_08845 [Gammaproteobacteria bacterium]